MLCFIKPALVWFLFWPHASFQRAPLASLHCNLQKLAGPDDESPAASSNQPPMDSAPPPEHNASTPPPPGMHQQQNVGQQQPEEVSVSQAATSLRSFGDIFKDTGDEHTLTDSSSRSAQGGLLDDDDGFDIDVLAPQVRVRKGPRKGGSGYCWQ